MNDKKTAVEWLANVLKQNHGIDLTLYSEFNQAKEMEFEQRKKDFVNGYKSRAKESNLIFDETSEMYAIKLFNETFKSE
jgi:tRNA A-37 threonylcarbamoyl transferase component Bud32